MPLVRLLALSLPMIFLADSSTTQREYPHQALRQLLLLGLGLEEVLFLDVHCDVSTDDRDRY